MTRAPRLSIRPLPALVTALALAACTAEEGLLTAAPGSEADLAGSMSGEIEVRIVDHFDGTSERRYLLNVPGRSQGLRLAFAEDPALAPGTELSVWGSSEPSGQLRVAGWKTLRLPAEMTAAPGDWESTQRALIGAAAFPKRKMAFVLVDLGGGVNITAEQARAKAFGLAPADQSMKQVVLEYSNGRQDIEGEVLGPFKTTMTGCDEDGVAARLRPMVPAGFDNIVWYLGQRQSACGWAGVAPLGRAGKPAGQLWVNGTASCRVATHEFGHNLGLQHAARLRCTGASMADDLTKCTSSEYGDSADVMGDGCNHFNGYSKAYLTWFEKCNGVQVKSTGSFTLLPMESACDGTQVLFVPMAKLRKFGGTDLLNYALELRAPIGLDSRFQPTVMVRLVAAVSQMRGARMTWIVDTNPATTTIDGLKQGETFMDPAGGTSFTVEAISATSATVKVTVAGDGMGGGATCLDGTPFTPPGSMACANAAPTPVPPTPVSDAGTTQPPGGPADAGAPPPKPPTGSGGAGPATSTGGTPSTTGSGGRSGTPGTGGTPSAGAGGSAPTMPSGTTPAEGCSCEVGTTQRPPVPLALALGLFALVGFLRRRR